VRLTDAEARQRVTAIEGLLERLGELPEPSRDAAFDAVSAIVELYGEALARLLEHAGERERASELHRFAAGDELLSHLLLLHDLHPDGVALRVEAALEEVRPYLASHGGGVVLLGVDGNTARVRLEGSCKGCHASTETLRSAVEDAVLARAPELERVVAEDLAEPAAAAERFVPLASLRRHDEAPGPRWQSVAALDGLPPGAARVETVAGRELLFLRLDETLFAYHRECPACAGQLDANALVDGEVRCSVCGGRFDPRRAGRALDGGELQLRPVPLLSDASGLVRVALGEAA